ncbi:MAG: N-acetylneuraminate lyase [Planctomycetaceae bacterium]|nr:MAG: N-acetylneuraminate lyase [Planctomycetaceae bacterium]
MSKLRLQGLTAAVFTPWTREGELHGEAIETQAAHLYAWGIRRVFVGGTTGECTSLTVEERMALAERWCRVGREQQIEVIVHVGSNCLRDSQVLAKQAQRCGALAIAAFAPHYFKPDSVDALVACCQQITSEAPELPFYYYDIPGMTGVKLSMPDFLQRAHDQIKSLAGLKFTNTDLVSYQHCLLLDSGRYDILWGVDEMLLAALACGACGAVGSSYNFAAPIYHRLWSAWAHGDCLQAQREQYRAVQVISLLSEYGYLAAAKCVMQVLGVEVGPVRLPLRSLQPDLQRELIGRLESLGFFDWIHRPYESRRSDSN